MKTLLTGFPFSLLLAFFAASAPAAERLTLSESVDSALQHNLDLKIVRTGENIAGSRLAVERARFDPALTANTGVTDRRSPSGGSDLEGAPQNTTASEILSLGIEQELPSGASVALRGNPYDRTKTNSAFANLNPELNSRVSLDVRQPLLADAGFVYNLSPIRLAELQLDRSNLDTQIRLLETLRETEFAYWLVVATGRAAEIRRNAIELGNFILEEAVERERASLATKVDILEARAAVAEKEEAVLSTDKLHEDAKDNLFKVMGILDKREPGDLLLEDLPTNALFRPDPRESFNLALAHAPAHLVELNLMRQREIERRRARNQSLPNLDFVASSGFLGRDATQSAAYDRLSEGNGYFWDVGFQFRLPWGRRAEKARYSEALTQLERQRLTTDQVKLQLYADVRVACREVILASERLDATRVTEELNTEKFEQRKTEQGSGQTTMRELLEAQEDMEEAQLRHLEANVELLDAITALGQIEGTLPSRYGLLISGDSRE